MEKIKNIRGLLGSSRRKGFRIRSLKKAKNEGEEKQGEAEIKGTGEAARRQIPAWQIYLDGLSGYPQSQVAGNDSGYPKIPERFGLKFLVISLIKFYQKAISPMFPHTCRFYPTCSNYSIEAISKYGVIKGGLMSLWRVLRCNPFNPGGYDPVR